MQDPLAKYKSKRNFSVTTEPAEGGTPGQDALQYVIQKHWASRLHYDLRLELNGTMKSWAVPKGPSFDPHDKRMAVQVEDHPIAYNSFEGQIPPKQYGAGRVVLWDRGYWVPEGDPEEGYRTGKLKFQILGHKLKGRWTLVRMHGRASERQPPWLLIKERDGTERPSSEFDVVQEMPDSVASLPALPSPGRRGVDAPVWSESESEDADARTALPAQLEPQLATLVDGPPADIDKWIWELKFDGYRLLARLEHGKARLFTRTGKDWTAKMPALAAALARLPLQQGWIDGEVLMLDAHGIPDFQALQNAFDGSSTDALVFYAFDLPYAEGKDLRSHALVARRDVLRQIIAHSSDGTHVRFSESFEATPQDLVASACKLGFEGVIGKRADSAYVSRRSGSWIKLKCHHRQEFVIGGYTAPRGSRSGLGSLLLGVYDESGALRYAGNVGTGFSERVLLQLTRQLQSLKSPKSPFDTGAPTPAKAYWVEPALVAEVSFAEWTKEGKIRHSVFKGLRTDKPSTAIHREKAQKMSNKPGAAKATVNSTHVSHPERVIDETSGTTKIDLVRYYATVAPLMQPHLAGRPVSLVRAPDGVAGELFFQKHWDLGRLDGVHQLSPELYPEHPPLLEIPGSEGLLAAAQMNCVEFHTWNARKDKILRPDRMTFDLDPGEGVAWENMQEAATLVRLMLTELDLPAFLKTSGGKGLHIVVPLKRLHDWDTVKDFSHALVEHLAKTIPQRFVAKSGPRNRVGKIFVDYLRNGWGATTASAWTARARPGMGISVPVGWTELETITSGAHWNISTVARRLRTGNGPWAEYEKSAVSLTKAIRALSRTK